MVLDEKKARRFGYFVASVPLFAFVAIYFWYGFAVSPYIVDLTNVDPPWWPSQCGWTAVQVGLVPPLLCGLAGAAALLVGGIAQSEIALLAGAWACVQAVVLAFFYMRLTF